MSSENLNGPGRLPPLNALRAFECVARHLSVRAAAAELCVTAGAVSQQLKIVEGYFSAQLVSRHPKGVALTPAGQAYALALRNGFREIAEASHALRTTEPNRLRVSTTTFFAAEWLVPRLKTFQTRHPEIDIDVLTGGTAVDLLGGEVDVAIRHGMGHYPGLVSIKLLEVDMIPVASKALLKELGKPARAVDLLQWPLIHEPERKAWAAWFRSEGIADPVSRSGVAFADGQLQLRAALHSQGAALLPVGIVEAHDRRSDLVRLAGRALVSGLAYYFVCAPKRADMPKVVAFQEWLHQQTDAGGKRYNKTRPPERARISAAA
jgi:LysR family glycine cleavage system transcriptional activator